MAKKSASKPVLETHNLHKIYSLDGGSVHAVHDVNLAIEEGEFVAIMGASGSGKSTLMHLLGCLDIPTKGKVIFEGKDVSALSESELSQIRNQKVGFVFQTFNLLPRTSALSNVELPLLYDSYKPANMAKRARQSLEAVGLSHRADHHPSQLSGGEQQRVAIARALVNRPSIIFADEPTGNLDSTSGKEIMEVLKKLNQQGHTVVVVTHELHIAAYAKRTIKLKDGKIIE